MGRVVGGAARGTVDHGGCGHRLVRMVLAGRDAGRRAGYRGQGELLHTGMRESISRGDSCFHLTPTPIVSCAQGETGHIWGKNNLAKSTCEKHPPARGPTYAASGTNSARAKEPKL